ncbi:MAG: ATP-binding cassette domain-containing protein [Deltaproteobacteria bacterium]|nr:ATP-binding cassette domain-containing protein [Deltaproteobacteria bacterium]
MNLFEIRELTKTYGDRTVLDLPRLDFEKGFVYALLGPNGSGKTTLLEILCLLSRPTTGHIRYLGKALDFRGNRLFSLRREIIMVHQNPVLFSTTVRKNLEFGLKIRGISRKERSIRIGEALEIVGLRDCERAQGRHLSGGETQRVAIARALVCYPKVLLLDEPTSNMDMESQAAVERIIRDINEQKGISVIFTTHDMVQASRLSQKVLSLFEGKKVPAPFENIFSGRIDGSGKGPKSCLVHDRVRLSLGSGKPGPVRLCIDPLRVQLSTGDRPFHGENSFKGKVIQVTDEKEFVRVILDIGIPLHVRVPKENLGRSLWIGDEALVHIPPEALQLL